MDHVSVEAWPEVTLLGLALSAIMGGNAETVTVADCPAEPPAPVQISSYSVVLESAPVDQAPLVATSPCQPPEAVHAVAFAEFQVKLDAPPFATVDGDAVSVTVGTGAGAGEDTTTVVDPETDPLGPLHVNVKLVVEVSGSVVALPLVG